MTLDFLTDALITILLLPLQMIFLPVDFLLDQIPGIAAVPDAISNVTQFIGSIPGTLVNILGIQPLIWNALFVTFVLYIGLAPAIQAIKKVWAWVRP